MTEAFVVHMPRETEGSSREGGKGLCRTIVIIKVINYEEKTVN